MSARPKPRAAAAAAAAAVAAVFVATVAGGWSTPVGAHPLGNFTVNHYAGLRVGGRELAVRYVLDLAELPAFQERPALDADRSGGADAAELAGYAAARCPELAAGLAVRLDGEALAAQVRGAAAEAPPGEAGLSTLRVECAFAYPFAGAAGRKSLSISDGNGAGRVGWRELTATAGAGASLDSDLPARSVSDELRTFPNDAPAPDRRDAQLVVTLDPAAAAGEAGSVDGAAAGAAPDSRRTARAGGDARLTGLIAGGRSGLAATTAALLVAAGLGALHGLAPGHGKTVVAAYLVGSRGTRRQAGVLALAVALSHTLGVFVLGGVTLAASAAFAPERVYPWLQAASALIVVGLGAWLLVRLAAARLAAAPPAPHHHSPAPRPVLVGASLAGPPPDHHDHAHHDHDHDRDHHDHDHDHDHHDHDHHSHGLLPHRHRVAWDRLDVSGPLSWRLLAALGLSGGMLPSASAVIVLLGAVQVGRVEFGAALILAFGVGLAAALVGVGLGAVALTARTRRALDVRRAGERVSALATPVAAAAVFVVGLWLCWRAAGALGWR
ncbi:MAG: hypothetical protein ACKVWR_03155 [Acidimicrobiales bacterium]